MAANTNPVFALKPEVKTAVITAATTDKSGATPGNIKDLLTATTDGTKISWIKAKHVGSSQAGILLIWVTDTSGANPRLFAELAYTSITSSATVATSEVVAILPDLQLKAGQKVQVGATAYSTDIHVTAQIGDFS